MFHKQFLYLLFAAGFLLALLPALASGEYLIEGEFDAFSPTYDRIKSTNPQLETHCETPSEDSQNDGVAYAHYKVVVNQTGYLGADIIDSNLIDPMLALYSPGLIGRPLKTM